MAAALKYDNPANRRPPSDRDVQIYFAHKCDRKLQKDLAWTMRWTPAASRRSSSGCGCTWRMFLPARASSIMASSSGSSGAWNASGWRGCMGIACGCWRSSRSRRRGAEEQGGEVVGTTTREERSARVQALKSATRLAESLGKIAEREPAPQPTLHGANGYVPLDLLTMELMRQRQVAERTRGVPAVDDQVRRRLVPAAGPAGLSGQAGRAGEHAGGFAGSDRGGAERRPAARVVTVLSPRQHREAAGHSLCSAAQHSHRFARGRTTTMAALMFLM